MKKIAMFSWFVIPFDGFPSRKNYKILNCPHPKSRAPTLTGLEIARRNLSRLRDRSHRWLMVIRDQISSLVTGHLSLVTSSMCLDLTPLSFPLREKSLTAIFQIKTFAAIRLLEQAFHLLRSRDQIVHFSYFALRE